MRCALGLAWLAKYLAMQTHSDTETNTDANANANADADADANADADGQANANANANGNANRGSSSRPGIRAGKPIQRECGSAWFHALWGGRHCM